MSKEFVVSMVLGATLAGGTMRIFNSLREKTQGLTEEERSLTAQSTRYKSALAKLHQSYRKNSWAHENFENAVVRLKSKLNATRGALRKYRAEAERVRREANQAKRMGLQGDLMATAEVVASVAAPVMAAVSFESAMVDAGKNVKGIDTKEDKVELASAIREIARTSPMAVEGVARLASEAGKIGMNKQGALAFAQTAERIGTAFDISADKAGVQLTKIMGQMKLSVGQVSELADAVNFLGDNSKSNAANITQILASSGGVVVGATSLAHSEIAALAAVLDGVSPNAETAATALKNMTYALTLGEKASGTQKAALSDLGFSAANLAQKMQTDAKGAILDVMNALKGVEDNKRAGLMESLFGRESLGAIAPLVNDTEELSRVLGIANDKTAFAGSVNKEYERKLESTEAKLKIFKNQLTDLGIVAGTVLLPPLQTATSVLGAVFGIVGKLMERFPALTGVVMTGVGILVAFKVGALAAGYAATFLSDGLAIARTLMLALRPSVLAANFALARQRVILVASAVAQRSAIVATKVWTGAKWALNAALNATGARVVAVTVAQKSAMAATRLWTAVQWALNVALNANPIGLIVAGVAALAGAAYMLIKYWEPIKEFFLDLWDMIGSGVGWAMEKLSGVASFFGFGGDEEAQAAKAVPDRPQTATLPKVAPQNAGNQTFHITQQPGEDGEALARRVADKINRFPSGALYDG